MKQQLGENEIGQIKTEKYERYNQKGMHPHNPNTNFNTIILLDKETGAKKVYYDPHIIYVNRGEKIRGHTWRIEPKMQRWINENLRNRIIIAW